MNTFKKRTGEVKVDAVRVENFGKDFLKTKKVSPDAMMQLSFQVHIILFLFFDFYFSNTSLRSLSLKGDYTYFL